MPKTKIIFLRHGEVENPEKQVYGRLSGFPLSTKGIKDIKDIAKKLQNESIDIIFTSPLLRTKQTANLIGKFLDKKPIITRLLIEVDSRPVESINTEYFHKFIEPIFYTKLWQRKGIESPESIKNRMLKFVRLITKKYPGRTVLAVSHGDPMVILKAFLDNKKFNYDYKIKNYIPKGQYFTIER